MKPKTELLLYRLAWKWDHILRPVHSNLIQDFECWAERNGELKRIHELEALGFLEKHPEPNAKGAVVALTKAADRARSPKANPAKAWSRKWDRTWHQVLFDLEATEFVLRKQLHRSLRRHGFGCLQGSVWVHPFFDPSLQRVAREPTGRPTNLLHLKGQSTGPHTDRWIVEDAWNWDQIDRGYLRYLDFILTPLPDQDVRNQLGWVRCEKKFWNQAVREDPLLPAPLLPDGYLGKEAWDQRQSTLTKIDIQLAGT